jgi:hypothetical protein
VNEVIVFGCCGWQKLYDPSDRVWGTYQDAFSGRCTIQIWEMRSTYHRVRTMEVRNTRSLDQAMAIVLAFRFSNTALHFSHSPLIVTSSPFARVAVAGRSSTLPTTEGVPAIMRVCVAVQERRAAR